MALYKGSGPLTQHGSRIDGTVWDRSAPGATIRGWPNPRLHPSNRFVQYDGTAADLDRIFDTLDAETKAKWLSRAAEFWMLLLCPDKWFELYQMHFGTTDRDAYRGTNMARMAQGLPPVSEPPEIHTLAAADEIAIAQNPDVQITWYRTAPTIPYKHVAMIWARPRLTFNPTSKSIRKYRYIETIEITPATPVSIAAALSYAGMTTPGQIIDLHIGIAELGNVPFAHIFTTIKLEANPMISWYAAVKPTTRPDGSTLQVNDEYLDTTNHLTWFWDGLHWLSYEIFIGCQALLIDPAFTPTSDSFFDNAQMLPGYNVFVLDLIGNYYQQIYDGTNRFAISLAHITTTWAATYLVPQFIVVPPYLNRWNPINIVINAFVDAHAAPPNTPELFWLYVPRYGTPAVYATLSMRYRLVMP